MEFGYAYARYSSEKQTEASIDAQLRAIREYAASHDIQILGVYTDEAISGKGSRTAQRKEYQKMLRDIQKRQVTVILVHQYDRVARNLGEHVNLEKKLDEAGARLIAVAQDLGSGKESKIIKALLWSMSEYYIDNLAEETRKGLKENALKGLHNGGYAPFGYSVLGRKYVINELEAGYVRRIFDAAANREGFTAIIQEMDSAGIKGKRGKPIRYTQIYEMLRNEKYTGTYTYSTTEEKARSARREKPHAIKIENALPMIISKAQFQEVQRIMDERKQTGRKAAYLCSGLVYCQCGAKMHGMTSRRKGHEYRYFVCSKKCGAPVVKMEEVDTAAVNYLRDLLSPQNQAQITLALRRYQAGEGYRMDEFNTALKKRISEKRKEYDGLLQKMTQIDLPADVSQSIANRMHEINEEIAVLEGAEPPKDFTVDTIKAWLESLKATPDEKAIHLLVERIDVKQKTDINISSTLKSVLSEHGCGGAQHSLPKILFCYYHARDQG